MSIDNYIRLHFLQNANFTLIRDVIIFLVILFFAMLNVDDNFTGVGLYYAIGISLVLFAFPTGINLYVLIPRLLMKNKLFFYGLGLFASVVISLLVYCLVVGYLFEEYGVKTDIITNENPYSFIHIMYAIIIIGMISMGTTSIELFRQWVNYDRQITELEKMTMQTELEQLKNQINPHFLFNMLNSANILVKEDPGEASRLLSRLDDMLRYQLNDSTRQEVFLSADIHFLTGFLELEKMRRDHFEYVVSKEGDVNNTPIPPLLFIPFVENAVKHNTDSENLSYIYLDFKVEHGYVKFTCENSKPVIPVKQESGGLGLANIRRRLELLYGENHSLRINETETEYSVYLQLKL
ncbi:sensor histidine kinase [Butyricimonas synergistica]|uniref:sensor histidine kinase n=1 Tax=Butyricimonas synergistica TaxID=544644 RepID=UPI00037EFDDE|nr:histidine kinase [Butyricimonas synergistica]